MNQRVLLIQVCLLAGLCLAQTNVTGSVTDESGAALKNGTVTAMLSGAEDRRIVTIAASGKYEFSALPAGAYDFRFEAPGFEAKTEKKITLNGTAIRLDEVLAEESDPTVKPERDGRKILTVIAALLAYFMSIVVTRWYKIAKPSRNFLISQIASLENQLECNRAQNPHRIVELKQQLEDLRELYVKPAKGELFKQFLFWSQSAENASWISVHEIERELAAYLSPIEAVHTGLIVIVAKLKAIGNDSATAIATAIEAELGQKKPNAKLRSQLLAAGTGMVYSDRDENYTSLMDWQNKAMWLILLSSVLLMVLAVAAGNLALFLAGACGGLLSRLMRSLQISTTPVDYGASWSTFFLSPIFGAFSGWFGIGMIMLLTNPSVGLLGKAFTLVSWGTPLKLSTLTLAFLCGFSERFFNSLVDAVQNQTTQANTSPTPGTPGAPAAADPQAAGQTNAAAADAGDSAGTLAYGAAKAKVAGWISSGNAQDKARAIAFLVAMGQEAGADAAPGVLTLIESKVEGLVGTDESRQSRYVLEVERAANAAPANEEGGGNGD